MQGRVSHSPVWPGLCILSLLTVVAALGTALPATNAAAAVGFDPVPGYDEEGYWEGSDFCPIVLPTWGWFYTTWQSSYHVPIAGQPAGVEVDFSSVSLALTTQIQRVQPGWGWFQSFPNRARQFNQEWIWAGPGSGQPGGTLHRCMRQDFFFGLLVYRTVDWTGEIWGYAYPDVEAGSTDGTFLQELEGGDPEAPCWVLIAWWYDDNWVYHEAIISSWCEGEFEI